MIQAETKADMVKYNKQCIDNHHILMLLSLIPILLIMSLGYISWEWADDYSIKFLSVKFNSTIGYLFDRYMQWDGRSLTLPAVIQILLIKHTSAPFAGIIWVSCFMVTSYFILQIILYETNLKSSYSIILLSVIALLLWHGMYSHISETVYWMTGGIYICYAMIGVIWCYVLITKKIFKLNYILITLISFVAGATSHNLISGLFVLLVWYFVLDLVNSNKTYLHIVNKYSPLFLGLSLGAGLIIAAPGNYVRASYNNNSFDSSLLFLTSYFSSTTIYYIKNSMLLIMLSPIVSVVLFRFCSLRHDIAKENTYKAILNNSKWFIVAVSTVLPMVFVPGFVSPRTGIFFQIFIAIFCVLFIVNIIELLFKRRINKFSYFNELLAKLFDKQNIRMVDFIVVLIMLVNSIYIYYECHNAYMVKNEIDRRVGLLSKHNGNDKDLVIDKICCSVPNSKKFNDIGIDSEDWKNVAVAQYFGLDSIRTAK